MPMPVIPRTITINVSLDPPISGFGGWDEWTLESLTSEETDKLMDGIEAACNAIRPNSWTGSN